MIKEKYKENYYEFLSYSCCDETKYGWCASEIFNLATYDEDLDIIFVKKIFEVCKVIMGRTNFDYIANKENYIWYIVVCQLLREMDWIDWGTSIRGAWINSYDKHNIIADVPLKEENLQILIEFVEEEKNV